MEALMNVIGNVNSFSWGGIMIFFLVGTGFVLTVGTRVVQFRKMRYAFKLLFTKTDSQDGDITPFQALMTSLAATIGTGNIAGVAGAIAAGGPGAVFWMWVTAAVGGATKFGEGYLALKYRITNEKGEKSGGPMYYMKKRLNINLKNGKIIQTGKWLGIFFAGATILSSFGSGSMPQINSITDSVLATFGIERIITGAVMAVLLAFVIIGGIKRIAKVTERLVPGMALIYLVGALAVIITNYQNIIPSFGAIFSNVLSGQAAVGGFIGASFAFMFNQGVNRGLFSNEAGQGSAPIAHSAARAHEPVSEGMVAILEPFIDTIIICTITGLVLLSSGVWNQKIENQFQNTDMIVFADTYQDDVKEDQKAIFNHLADNNTLPLFNGELNVTNGDIQNELTIVHARSIAEDMKVLLDDKPFNGIIKVTDGKVDNGEDDVIFTGKSLMHSAPLTAEAFTKLFFGEWGKYIVSIGLLVFAFLTAISWSFYGDRSVTFLFWSKYVIIYRLLYVVGFFFAVFTDTTIIWNLSLLTVVFMAIPNLTGILLLHKEVR